MYARGYMFLDFWEKNILYLLLIKWSAKHFCKGFLLCSEIMKFVISTFLGFFAC